MPIYCSSTLRMTPTDSTGSFPADTEGAIYYDDSEAQLKHYDGTNWGRVSRDLTWGITPGYGPYTADLNTKLLIHSDTTDDNTDFWDDSHFSRNITRSNALHKTAQKKIGATSMYFDGDGDYLTTAQSTDWQFGTGDYTIDFWLNWEAVSSNENPICYGAGDGVEGWKILFDATTATWYGGSGVGSLSVPHGVSAGVWYHWAVVRKSMVVTQYKNGVALGSSTHTGTMGATSSLGLTIGAINQTSSQEWNGFLDEIHISKGIARWTSNFTVY